MSRLTIALFPNKEKPQALAITASIFHFLSERGVTVVFDDDHQRMAGLPAIALSSTPPDEIDFIVSLGGDGTILRLIHRHPQLKAPLLGINLGNLGFMADIPIHDIYPSFEDLIAGYYTIQERMVIEGMLGTSCCMAINEMVIHRAQNHTLIDLAIYVDGTYVNTFAADGVIIATPNGSTAYSLAAGGPILTPELDALVLTPISPHTISNRAIVLMPKREIQVKYLNGSRPVEITSDGITTFPIRSGDTFLVKRSEKKFRLVNLLRHNYFAILREKLGWTGSLRRERFSYENDPKE